METKLTDEDTEEEIFRIDWTKRMISIIIILLLLILISLLI